MSKLHCWIPPIHSKKKTSPLIVTFTVTPDSFSGEEDIQVTFNISIKNPNRSIAKNVSYSIRIAGPSGGDIYTDGPLPVDDILPGETMEIIKTTGDITSDSDMFCHVTVVFSHSNITTQEGAEIITLINYLP